MGKTGERPPHCSSALAKPGYLPVLPDDSRQEAANGRKRSTTSLGNPISGRERLPMPGIVANSDAGNRTSASQSAVLLAPMEVERSLKTASNGAWEPTIGAHTATRTPPAKRSINWNRSSTGKETELYQSTSTPEPQLPQTAGR